MSPTQSPPPDGPRQDPRWAAPLRDLAARPWARWGVLVLVILAAGFARTQRCNEGLPYLHRWGEPNIGARSLEILRTGDLNPHWFRYGSPTIYLHAGVDAAHYIWLCSQPEDAPHSIRSLDEIRTKVDTNYRWTLSHPSFFLWNRWVTALLGTGAVLLTFLLARHVAGPWAATFATALVAGAAVHIEVSSTIRSDMPAAVLALGAVLATLRAWGSDPTTSTSLPHAAPDRARPSALALAFLLAGLAASTKYNLVLSLAAPAFALALAALRHPPLARPWLVGAALLLPPLAFVLGSPFALFDLPTFLRDAGAEVSHYKFEGQGNSTVEAGLPNLVHQFGEFRHNLPLVALLLAGAGALLLLRAPIGWILLAFPLGYIAFMVRTTVDFHHNFVVVYPFMAAFAAHAVDRLHAHFRQRHLPGAAAALAVACIGLCAFHVLPQVAEAHHIHGVRETRTRAVELVNELAAQQGWKRVGIASELRMHRIDLEQLEVEYEVLELEELVESRAPFDALVCPTEIAPRNREGDAAKRRVAALNRLTDDLEVLGSVEGGPLMLDIRSIHPGVSVVRPRGEP